MYPSPENLTTCITYHNIHGQIIKKVYQIFYFRDDSLGEGAEEKCETFYETACTTKYVEKRPGKFVGDTKCEKLPVELCGVGCKVEEGK